MSTDIPAPRQRALGPRGLPGLGSLLEIRRDPLAYLTRMAREHGDVVRIRVGLKTASW